MLFSGDVVASITVVVIFLVVAIDFFNVYLAVDVTIVNVVFIAIATVIVVTVAAALIKIDVVCHTVIMLPLLICFCQYYLP